MSPFWSIELSEFSCLDFLSLSQFFIKKRVWIQCQFLEHVGFKYIASLTSFFFHYFGICVKVTQGGNLFYQVLDSFIIQKLYTQMHVPILCNKTFDIHFLKEFGCSVLVLIPIKKNEEPFVGYIGGNKRLHNVFFQKEIKFVTT